jgi:hypothetical protein
MLPFAEHCASIKDQLIVSCLVSKTDIADGFADNRDQSIGWEFALIVIILIILF